MTPKEIAVQIAERYLLSPGEAIVGVTEHDGGVEVKSRHWHWCVSPIGQINRVQLSHGYRFYGIDQNLEAARDGGVAVLPDARMFRIDDAGELRAFVAAARRLITPIELAAFLASYHAPEETGAQNLIVKPETLARPEQPIRPWITAEQLASLPLTAPEATAWGEDTMRLSFCTRFVDDSGDEDAEPRLSFDRWHVEAGPGAELHWRITPVARRLVSPFYSRGG